MADFTNGYTYTSTTWAPAASVLPATFGRVAWTAIPWTGLFVHQHLNINPTVTTKIASTGQIWPR